MQQLITQANNIPNLTKQQILEYFSYHLISLLAIFSIILTIAIHYMGSNKNKNIAQHYRNKILSPLLSKWFKKYDGQLVYQAPNIAKLYPSERQSCLFAIISFALVPRQQVLSFFFNFIFFRLKDQLVIEIPVNNQFPVSLTAAIVRRKNIKSITKKTFPDIKQLCKEYKPLTKNKQENKTRLNVPDSHCILVEKLDHVRYFLQTNKQAQTWQKHGKSVKLVYISDVNKFSRYPMAVRMVINMGNQKDIEPMLEWLINFVDRIAKVKQGTGERKQAIKKRENLDIKYQ